MRGVEIPAFEGYGPWMAVFVGDENAPYVPFQKMFEAFVGQSKKHTITAKYTKYHTKYPKAAIRLNAARDVWRSTPEMVEFYGVDKRSFSSGFISLDHFERFCRTIDKYTHITLAFAKKLSSHFARHYKGKVEDEEEEDEEEERISPPRKSSRVVLFEDIFDARPKKNDIARQQDLVEMEIRLMQRLNRESETRLCESFIESDVFRQFKARIQQDYREQLKDRVENYITTRKRELDAEAYQRHKLARVEQGEEAFFQAVERELDLQ